MKKFFCLLVLAFISLASYSQPKMGFPFKGVNLSQYTESDSLVLEWGWIYKEDEIKVNENVIDCGSGYYMVKFHKPIVVRFKTNADRTKAVLEGMNPMFVFMEYNLFENDHTIVLWYKNKRRYSGFTYNKTNKSGNIFSDTKKDFKLRRGAFGRLDVK